MLTWWAEEWRIGSGVVRISCGITRTDEGYTVVDVFRDDTRVESFLYRSRAEAVQAAELLKLQYRDGRTTLKGSGDRPPFV